VDLLFRIKQVALAVTFCTYIRIVPGYNFGQEANVTRMKEERVPKKKTEGIQRREKTSLKAQKETVRCSEQKCYEDVEIQELE
jgi:hypothetical protein